MFNRMWLSQKIEKVPVILSTLIIISSVVPLHAQTKITLPQQISVREINPDQSDMDAGSPNRASGGRVNGLANVPGSSTVFYAASEWGGLFKTTDAGQNWFHLSRHVPTATWDVEIDLTDQNLVYATSLYDGQVNSEAGINVSKDGGKSWSHPATPIPSTGFCQPDIWGIDIRVMEPAAFGISVDPDSAGTVYVGTNCGLAISADSGVTWSIVDPTPLDPADDVWDVAVHDNGIIDVCGDDGHMRSTDGGITWTPSGGPLLGGGRCSIAISPHEANVIFVTQGQDVHESDDGGATWTPLGTPDRRRQGRVPFVVTNPRSANTFDLWFGDVSLFRGACTSNPAGGGLRCPMAVVGNPQPNPPAGWSGPFTRTAGAHDDVGDLAFDPTRTDNDACPILFSNDGGVYLNTTSTDPNCHTPTWEQPNKTPHALWLWDMTGVDQAGSNAEDLYFGTQDNGAFGTRNAGVFQPTWTNPMCCDGFDTAADTNQVLFTICCSSGASRLRLASPGMISPVTVQPNSHPNDGLLPTFNFTSSIAQFANAQYAVITQNCPLVFLPDGIDNDGDGNVDELDETRGCRGLNGGDGGLFITTNVANNTINWTELGNATEPAAAMCGVKAAVSGNNNTPSFFVQTGGCRGVTLDQVWVFTGTNPASNWQQINPPSGVGGFGIFTVDPDNPNRLFASHLQNGPNGTQIPQMVFSSDGGATWISLPQLDTLMTANGVFKYDTQTGPGPSNSYWRLGYPQPTLVAFHPTEDNILIAGGADSGVFFSVDGGTTWKLATNPTDPNRPIRRAWYDRFNPVWYDRFNPAVIGGFKPLTTKPHIPRPRYAYFDEEPNSEGNITVFVGTQGRGVWKLNFNTVLPSPWEKCQAFPWICTKVEMLDEIIKLNCDVRGCIKLDPIPKNCLLKYGTCPGCQPGQLCPPFYHIFIEGHQNIWTVDLFDKIGNQVPHEKFRTPKGLVFSFRPTKKDYIEGQLADYFLTFEMGDKGKPGIDYQLKTYLKVSPSHYKPNALDKLERSVQ